MKQEYSSRTIYRFLATGVILSAFLMILTACAGNYGQIQRSREAGKIFESHEVLNDHIYYYSGPDAIPYAVIAIHQDYNLKSKLWKRINLSSDQLRSWLDLGMQGSLGFPPNGSYIYGPEGQRIGIWYSIFNGTVVRLENDNSVIVHPPMSAPGKNFRPALERGSVDFMELPAGTS